MFQMSLGRGIILSSKSKLFVDEIPKIEAERIDFMAVALKEDYQRALDEQTALGARKDYYHNYKIYYVIEEDTIYIDRILHMLVEIVGNTPNSSFSVYKVYWKNVLEKSEKYRKMALSRFF